MQTRLLLLFCQFSFVISRNAQHFTFASFVILCLNELQAAERPCSACARERQALPLTSIVVKIRFCLARLELGFGIEIWIHKKHTIHFIVLHQFKWRRFKKLSKFNMNSLCSIRWEVRSKEECSLLLICYAFIYYNFTYCSRSQLGLMLQTDSQSNYTTFRCIQMSSEKKKFIISNYTCLLAI